MIKRLRRKFIIVNMVIVTVMLAVIFGLILFFTKNNMERESIQMLRSVAMVPVQHGIPENVPQKTPPSVFAVYKLPDTRYNAWGSEVVDFSNNELLSEIYNNALNTKAETGIIEEYDLRFHLRRNPFEEAIFFADISGEIKTLRQLTYGVCRLMNQKWNNIWKGMSLQTQRQKKESTVCELFRMTNHMKQLFLNRRDLKMSTCTILEIQNETNHNF